VKSISRKGEEGKEYLKNFRKQKLKQINILSPSREEEKGGVQKEKGSITLLPIPVKICRLAGGFL